MIQRRIDWVYEYFLQKVAKGREKTRDQIHEMAQGRVWTGAKAKELGLVDDLGGMDRATAAAAKLAGLEKYRLSEYPRTQTALEQFIDKFTNKKDRDDSIKSWLVQSELGEMYPVYKSLRDIQQAKGLQARMPFELLVR